MFYVFIFYSTISEMQQVPFWHEQVKANNEARRRTTEVTGEDMELNQICCRECQAEKGKIMSEK